MTMHEWKPGDDPILPHGETLAIKIARIVEAELGTTPTAGRVTDALIRELRHYETELKPLPQ